MLALLLSRKSPSCVSRQFRKTVSKVPDTKDTIKFKLDTPEITYIVDMFCDTLHLLVETPDNLFITPVNIEVIESFMQRVGYQGVVDKVSAFYTKFLAQPWKTMFKCFNCCLTTQTSGRRMSSNTLKEPLPTSVIGMRSMEEVVEGNKDEEIHMLDKILLLRKLQDGVTMSGDRIEPGSHKEHPEIVDDDDDENKEEKKDDEMGMTDTVSPSTPLHPKDPQEELDEFFSKKLSLTTEEFWKVHGKVDQVLHEIIPQLAERATNDLIKGNLKRVVADTIIQEQDAFQSENLLYYQEFDAPCTQNHRRSFQEEEHFDKDEVIPEDETPELIREFQNVDKRVPTTFDRARIEATLNDMLSNRCSGKADKKTSDDQYQKLLFSMDHKGIQMNLQGIESYQIRVNLTASTLTFPGIEAHELYSIVDKPTTGLIYLNIKDEKRFWKKPPRLGELDLDIMRAFEREISKRLSHRQQMKRWESFARRKTNLLDDEAT
ncbi:hypothetical protein Tco_0734445 [Tanacetum coccineum]